MGERRKRPLRVNFDGQVKLEFHGATISSDAGLLLYRELDEAFGLTAGLKDLIAETRRGKNIQHSVTALLRQSVYGRLPAMRIPMMRHVSGLTLRSVESSVSVQRIDGRHRPVR